MKNSINKFTADDWKTILADLEALTPAMLDDDHLQNLISEVKERATGFGHRLWKWTALEPYESPDHRVILNRCVICDSEFLILWTPKQEAHFCGEGGKGIIPHCHKVTLQ